MSPVDLRSESEGCGLPNADPRLLTRLASLWLRAIAHIMLRQIVAYELSHHLRGREVEFGTQPFQGFFLFGIDQDGQARGFAFHEALHSAAGPLMLIPLQSHVRNGRSSRVRAATPFGTTS